MNLEDSNGLIEPLIERNGKRTAAANEESPEKQFVNFSKLGPGMTLSCLFTNKMIYIRQQ